ncbi:MAG: ShlB/FhaC/HecB family hemolysin secretion/activation protein [Planctomycetota bacterium]
MRGNTTRRGGLNGSASIGRMVAIAAALLVAAVLGPVRGADAQFEQSAEEPTYPFGTLRLDYATRHPELPLVDAFRGLRVPVDVLDGVMVAPVASGRTLGELLDTRDGSITASGLNAIAERVVASLNDRGIVGVLVAPDPAEVDPATGADLRTDRAVLTLRIWTGLVTDIRTVGTGDRFAADQVIDHPEHGRILRLSPAAPWDGRSLKRRDLLRREVLENYVFRLNRHPSRRVDLAVAPAASESAGPDATVLEYLVRESKPWTAYLQVSNTGTEQTNEVRERLGFVHNQLTGRDDILQLDFVTASFQDSYAGFVSYDAPLPGTTLARGRVFGTFSDYTASDIGLPGQDLSGTTATYGGELYVTAYQRQSLFVDLFGGVVGKSYEVTNDLAASEGDTNLLLGTAGVRLEDVRPTRSLLAEVAIDWTMDGGDADQLPALGRLRVDEFWSRLRWNAQASFYLEPLLWYDAWNDPTTPGSSTLAHEVVLAFRGQSVFDARVIPQEQGVVGGLATVRGYPESATAADTVYIASAEYRLHLPALLGIQSEPGTLFGDSFRWRRTQPYGVADWDLVLAGFVDYAQTEVNDAEPGEFFEELLGVGAGIGVSFRRNVQARVDWGVALTDLDNGEASAGDSEIHAILTLSY